MPDNALASLCLAAAMIAAGCSDAHEHKRIDAESPEYILDCPDYHALFTYTMFWGVVDA